MGGQVDLKAAVREANGGETVTELTVREVKAPEFEVIIARDLQLKSTQVRAAIRLLDEGNTIPFIARYRKEMTGELDENQLRAVAAAYQSAQNLFQRKSDVIRLLGEQGVLTDDKVSNTLFIKIERAATLTEVEDLYRPYRPKRKTRASAAREQGLAPLTEWLKVNRFHPNVDEASVIQYAAQFVIPNQGVDSPATAVQGAADIFAEELADDANVRKWIRTATFTDGILCSTAVDKAATSVYEPYYDFAEPVPKAAPHRVLAMNRGEREGFLRVSIAAPEEKIVRHLTTVVNEGRPQAGSSYALHVLEQAALDGYQRLIQPATERDIQSDLTAKAEQHAIVIFGANLRSLLMQPPIHGRVVLGVDPAFRTGCKLAVVDATGKLFEVSVIYPTAPQHKVDEARVEVCRLLNTHEVQLIAIGNGTASRETESFIADCIRSYSDTSGRHVPYAMVSEAGASVYSASPLAGEEFPSLNVSERSAISIARRLQDPMAELVKIDPKSIGVGQYQHDVAEQKLSNELAQVVESAVNQVGVDVNTASPSLLSYVAGLNKTVAKNVVVFREQNGPFRNRETLRHVPRLGPKTLEQCVGFLRVVDGDDLLDSTPIHPESYPAVTSLLQRTGQNPAVLKNDQSRREWIKQIRALPTESLSAEVGIGVPTLRDILDALERPGRDPRDDVPQPILRTDILKLEDLSVGTVLTGTVRNVVDFGAFVDIGLKNDGLVHISQLSNRFVKHPMDVVAVGDVVQVRVTQVNQEKQRVALSMKTAD